MADINRSKAPNCLSYVVDIVRHNPQLQLRHNYKLVDHKLINILTLPDNRKIAFLCETSQYDNPLICTGCQKIVNGLIIVQYIENVDNTSTGFVYHPMCFEQALAVNGIKFNFGKSRRRKSRRKHKSKKRSRRRKMRKRRKSRTLKEYRQSDHQSREM
jgi:hypothetical protein